MVDYLADVKRKARKKFMAMYRNTRRKKYAVKYFIIWPPPHPGRTTRESRSCWYWCERSVMWVTKEFATAYDTRQEAEEKSLFAAAARSNESPNGEALGKIRTSRQLVPLVRVEMSEV